MPFVRLLPFLILGLVAGCAKPKALPDVIVTATSPAEFTRFRADLETRFTPEQLKEFDTATLELQLDAMNRDVPTAAGRVADMVRLANGKTIREVTLIGWRARKARLLRETAEINRMLAHDLKQAEKTAATGTPESITRRIGSEKEVLAKLQANLAATERRLAELVQP